MPDSSQTLVANTGDDPEHCDDKLRRLFGGRFFRSRLSPLAGASLTGNWKLLRRVYDSYGQQWGPVQQATSKWSQDEVRGNAPIIRPSFFLWRLSSAIVYHRNHRPPPHLMRYAHRLVEFDQHLAFRNVIDRLLDGSDVPLFRLLPAGYMPLEFSVDEGNTIAMFVYMLLPPPPGFGAV